MTTTPATAERRGPAFDPALPVWRLLTSVRFAVFLIATLAALGLAGVMIPQVPEAMRGNEAAIDAWLDTKRDTFGPFTDPMHRLGLFELFHARWFLIALGFLVVNVSVCVFNRWSPTFRNVFRPPERVPDSFYERAHNRTALAPVSIDTAESALRAQHFRIKTREEAGAAYMFADRYPWAQLATFASHMALILFLAGGLVTALTGFSTEAFAGEGTTVPVFAVSDPNQMQVRIDDAVGEYGPKGNPLDFRTHLTIFRNGVEVKSGYMTVNDPLKYDGYRFHQVAFFADGAALRIRDATTGNTVFSETFPLEEIVAAPAITVRDAAGNELLRDLIAPTLVAEAGSGALVNVPGAGRVLWVGIVAKDEETWQLVTFDPQSGQSGQELRIDEGASGEIDGLRITFDDVSAIPAAVGVDVPGGGDELLAQMIESPDGATSLLLTGEGRPAISLTPGEPVTVNGYTYIFEGPREFAGLSVKRDSGAWFIWIATGLLVGGLALTFYVPRRRLWLKLTATETRIAALAEKSGGFPGEMRKLARRLGVPAPPDIQEER
jgi:cytochrome c biogenesis protein